MVKNREVRCTSNHAVAVVVVSQRVLIHQPALMSRGTERGQQHNNSGEHDKRSCVLRLELDKQLQRHLQQQQRAAEDALQQFFGK